MRRIIATLRRLRDEQDGAALVEFGLVTAFLFLMFLTGLDFGAYYQQRAGINEALSGASIRAFETRDTVDFAGMTSLVRKLADDPTLQVTLECNGTVNGCTNSSRTCACLTSSGTFTSAMCNASCTGGSTAGYYLTIRAKRTFEAAVLPGGVLSGTSMEQHVTVRLE
jgi:Flp pilus assembly protein TadG